MPRHAGGPVVPRRALGRSTLHRQLLLQRKDVDVIEAVEHLVGLQAQIPTVPYTALWARLENFQPADLARAMRGRQVVRSALMRTTIHTVTAADCLRLSPLVQPVLDRTFASTAWGQRLRGQDIGDALATACSLVEQRPRTRAELARDLDGLIGGLDTEDVAWAFSYLVPTVQPTPRGLWGSTGRAVLTTTASWLRDRPANPLGLDGLVRRYLAAFGPATVRDVQAWCGLTRLREVTDGMPLWRGRTEDGAELLDLPDTVQPNADTPAPVRFLPEYDNALLGYADRSRVIADAEHVPLRGGPGGAVGTVLVDGLVGAMWALRRRGDDATLEVRASLALPAHLWDDVTAEGAAVLRFLAPRSGHRIELTHPQ